MTSPWKSDVEMHSMALHHLAVAASSTGLPIDHPAWDSFRLCIADLIEAVRQEERRIREVGEA